MILSATMMLRHLGLDHHANTIASSVYNVVKNAKIRTPDMGGESKNIQDFIHFKCQFFCCLLLTDVVNISIVLPCLPNPLPPYPPSYATSFNMHPLS